MESSAAAVRSCRRGSGGVADRRRSSISAWRVPPVMRQLNDCRQSKRPLLFHPGQHLVISTHASSLTIQRLAALTGSTARALRHYEAIGLLSPSRTRGGTRLYSPVDCDRALEIARLRRLDLPLAIIQRSLCTEVTVEERARLIDRALENQLDRLKAQIRLVGDALAERRATASAAAGPRRRAQEAERARPSRAGPGAADRLAEPAASGRRERAASLRRAVLADGPAE